LLEPPPTESARTLVDTLLASDTLAEVRELVVGRAEGNPFFVEEVLGSLIDQGVLERTNGSWTAHRPTTGFEIPDSVQTVLAARIDLLDEAEKAALQAAAVIGRIFWTGPVYELVAGMEPDLRVLEDRDFIRRRSGSSLEGEPEYAFKHALTREVAYGGLPKARRARLHAKFAEWIERIGEGRDEHAPLLAYHYAEAVRPEDADLCWANATEELERLRVQAVSWLERAADLAIGRYEIADALALLEQALQLTPDDVRQSALWRKVGRANALTYDGEAFWTAMERSLAVCTDREVCAESYADLAFQTSLRSGMWLKHPEDELVKGWIERAIQMSSPASATRAKALIARCLWEPAAGRETGHEAGALAEQLGDVELRSYALMALGNTAFGYGEYLESLHWAERGLELIPAITDPDHVADVYEIAIPAFCVHGQFDEAKRLAMEHRQVVKALSLHHQLHGVAITLEVAEVCGEWERILGLADRTQAAVEANLATPCIRNARSLLVTALAVARTGDVEAAEALEARANEVATEGYDLALSAPRAHLALVRGDLDLAVSLLPPYEEPWFHVRSWYAVATATARLDVLAAAGDRDRLEREAPQFLRPRIYWNRSRCAHLESCAGTLS
jgi:tetratricopeptide (TPR) repeat protein